MKITLATKTVTQNHPMVPQKAILKETNQKIGVMARIKIDRAILCLSDEPHSYIRNKGKNNR